MMEYGVILLPTLLLPLLVDPFRSGCRTALAADARLK
jgi:hypothetical protein